MCPWIASTALKNGFIYRECELPSFLRCNLPVQIPEEGLPFHETAMIAQIASSGNPHMES